jgi:protein-S-isoprenylcysteine O-methyltransferase Ste14
MSNALLLLAPSLLVGGVGATWQDDVVLGFLALATLFCASDLTNLWQAKQDRAGARDVETSRNDRLARRLALATGVSLLVVFWLGLSERLGHAAASPPMAAAAGAALMVLGSFLRFAAIRTLGAGFRTEFTPHTALVSRGVYGILRHPSETGLLCVAVGAALFLNSWMGLTVCALVIAPLVLWRLELEERRLRFTFGAAYEEYQRRVRRLIPWLY